MQVPAKKVRIFQNPILYTFFFSIFFPRELHDIICQYQIIGTRQNGTYVLEPCSLHLFFQRATLNHVPILDYRHTIRRQVPILQNPIVEPYSLHYFCRTLFSTLFLYYRHTIQRQVPILQNPIVEPYSQYCRTLFSPLLLQRATLYHVPIFDHRHTIEMCLHSRTLFSTLFFLESYMISCAYIREPRSIVCLYSRFYAQKKYQGSRKQIPFFLRLQRFQIDRSFLQVFFQVSSFSGRKHILETYTILFIRLFCRALYRSLS